MSYLFIKKNPKNILSWFIYVVFFCFFGWVFYCQPSHLGAPHPAFIQLLVPSDLSLLVNKE